MTHMLQNNLLLGKPRRSKMLSYAITTTYELTKKVLKGSYPVVGSVGGSFIVGGQPMHMAQPPGLCFFFFWSSLSAEPSCDICEHNLQQ